MTAPKARNERPRAVGWWLLGCAAMVFVMALIGAITRLTESGLSIMEWAPLSGALPPLSQGEWERLFALYQEIPEYQIDNAGMSLAEFKTIFWWEYIHRLWGRLIGLAFFLPLVWFWWRGALPKRLTGPLFFLFVLGGMQGLLGWYMVASGFGDRTDVSQYRLLAHLMLALFLYAALLWIALGLLDPSEDDPSDGAPRRTLTLALLLLTVTLASGALVAGTNAGMTYNSFPLMDGEWVPDGYGALTPWWLNWFETIEAVQFNHRLLAFVTLLVVWSAFWLGRRAPSSQRRPLTLAAFLALAQVALGITTLLLVVPVFLATVHQAGALLLLAALLWALHRTRPRVTLNPPV